MKTLLFKLFFIFSIVSTAAAQDMNGDISAVDSYESYCEDCGNPKAEPKISIQDFFSSRITQSELMKRPEITVKIIIDTLGNPKCKSVENVALQRGYRILPDDSFNYLVKEINKMPKWAPAIENGKPVNSLVRLVLTLHNNKLFIKREKSSEKNVAAYGDFFTIKKIPSDSNYTAPDKNIWAIHNQYNSDYPAGYCYSVCTDSNGVVWTFTSDGITKVDKERMTVFDNVKELGNIDGLKKAYGVISIGANNRKYITLNYKNVLIEYNDTTWTVTDTRYRFEAIHSAFRDPSGNLWFPSGEGFIKLNEKEIKYISKEDLGISLSRLRYIFIDKNNGMWIGSGTGSAFKDGEKYIMFDDGDSPLKNKSLSKAFEDKSRNIWFLLDDYPPSSQNRTDQIARLASDGKWTVFDINNSGINSSFIDDFEYNANNNNLWITCINGGIINYDGKLWTVFTPDNSDIPPAVFTDISLDKEGNLWVASSNGLFQIARKN